MSHRVEVAIEMTICAWLGLDRNETKMILNVWLLIEKLVESCCKLFRGLMTINDIE